jgi:GT2 family glycosyltransferase
MKIGVGITSYNRPSALEICLQSVRHFDNPEFELYVSDDGSSQENMKLIGTICKSIHAEIDIWPRAGIAKNKNRILHRFKDCDFIFILEDDLEIISEEWIYEHLQAHKDTGFHHFGHVLLGARGIIDEQEFPGGRKITFTEHCTGMFGFYTRVVLETVGGFDERFDLYGWEHMDYSDRIRRAGLCGASTSNYPSLSNIQELVQSMYLDSVLDVATRSEQQKKNLAVWELSRRETNLYRRF